MKLDRNTNPDGSGKYALIHMRKMIPILKREEETTAVPLPGEPALAKAFDLLFQAGIISLGNESPGDQFFVMKYKDKFTAPALRAYANAVSAAADADVALHGCATELSDSLGEYAACMKDEAEKAEDVGNRIPD